MRKHHFFMVISSLIVAGCMKPQATGSQYTNTAPIAPQTPQQVSTQNLSDVGGQQLQPASPQDNLCPSSEFEGLVGKKYQDIPQDQLPPYFRTLKPGQNLVMSQPARVNLYLDRRGVVSTVRCG